MLCKKCGTQISGDMSFCPKCGVEAKENQKDDFEEFVDNHIRKTTPFQSAKELLDGKVPMRFAQISFGVPALLGVVLCIFGDGNIFEKLFVVLFLVLVFGYLAAYIACKSVSLRYCSQYFGKYEGIIDIDDLRQFLNGHLNYLQPYFHEWGYLQRESTSIQGSIETKITEITSEALKEVKICTEFGEKQWRLAVICIRPDTVVRNSGKQEYLFSAENRIEGASFLSHDMGFAKYKCLFKTAPILQAAMEYYLKNYKKD